MAVYIRLSCLIICFFQLGSLQAQELKELKNLNSRFRETNLSITPNGKYLYFLSQRGGQNWSTYSFRTDDGVLQFDGDIWYSSRASENDEWSKPSILGKNINTNNGEDEPNISMDGQTMYFQSWRSDWEFTGGPYYKVERNGTTWTNPIGMGGEINRFFRDLSDKSTERMYKDIMLGKLQSSESYVIGTDGMAVSPNEKIFVVSAISQNGPNNSYDLYISRKNQYGSWSYPVPLSINTYSDEISVFIAGDNRTLYFASDKPGGYGGFDIYKATLLDGANCSKPVNIGAPYNSGADDYGFIVSSVEDEGYMVRNGDIYHVDLTPQAEPEKTLVINGLVRDNKGKPLFATIQLLQGGKELENAKSNSASGEFSFSQKQETGTFQLLAKTTDNRAASIEFKVTEATKSPLNFTLVIENPLAEVETSEEPIATTPPKPSDPEEDVAKKLEEEDLREGEVLRIDKLYFEADKAVILANSYPALDKIAASLKKRSKLVVEIGGHTNGLPNHAYCDALSTQRAENVYNYLVDQGVPKEQLRYKGYGKRVPLVSNDTKEGRRLNQRVEIKVLNAD